VRPELAVRVLPDTEIPIVQKGAKTGLVHRVLRQTHREFDVAAAHLALLSVVRHYIQPRYEVSSGHPDKTSAGFIGLGNTDDSMALDVLRNGSARTVFDKKPETMENLAGVWASAASRCSTRSQASCMPPVSFTSVAQRYQQAALASINIVHVPYKGGGPASVAQPPAKYRCCSRRPGGAAAYQVRAVAADRGVFGEAHHCPPRAARGASARGIAVMA
jgi:hypothetical protein